MNLDSNLYISKQKKPNILNKYILTYKRVSCGPMITTSHLYMSSSSIRPAEKPSTGFLLSSGKKDIWCFFNTMNCKGNTSHYSTRIQTEDVDLSLSARLLCMRGARPPDSKQNYYVSLLSAAVPAHVRLGVYSGALHEQNPHFHRVHPALAHRLPLSPNAAGIQKCCITTIYWTGSCTHLFWHCHDICESRNFLNVASYGNNESHKPCLKGYRSNSLGTVRKRLMLRSGCALFHKFLTIDTSSGIIPLLKPGVQDFLHMN